MKNLLSAKSTFAALGFALLVWTAPAGAQTPVLKFDIPFRFTAGHHALAAGEYRVSIDTEHLIARFDSAAGTLCWMVRFSQGGEDRQTARLDKGMLRFERYGARYVLTGVWSPGDVESKRVVSPKGMVEAAKSDAAGAVVISDSDYR